MLTAHSSMTKNSTPAGTIPCHLVRPRRAWFRSAGRALALALALKRPARKGCGRAPENRPNIADGHTGALAERLKTYLTMLPQATLIRGAAPQTTAMEGTPTSFKLVAYDSLPYSRAETGQRRRARMGLTPTA